MAKALTDVWENRFDTEGQATAEVASLQMQRQKLVGAVGVSLDAAKQRLQQTGEEDRWVDISLADYQFLTSDSPKKVAFAYKSALAGASDFYYDAARGQLELFQSLGVLAENTRAALDVPQPAGPPQPVKVPPARVILFTGHMVDAKETNPQRFPNSMRDRARDAIRAAVQQEINRTDGPVIGLASAANGGDLLFHAVCEDLKIESRLCLPLPPDTFRNESVEPAGPYWMEQFDELLKKYPSPPVLAASTQLPIWLSGRTDYTSWQRANLWLVQEALAVGARNFTLLALWDGVKTEGVGGTCHMRAVAQQYGAALVTIYTADILGADNAASVTV